MRTDLHAHCSQRPVKLQVEAGGPGVGVGTGRADGAALGDGGGPQRGGAGLGMHTAPSQSADESQYVVPLPPAYCTTKVCEYGTGR